MNPEDNYHIPDSPQDRITDALLSEHARLGRRRDEELVANILRNTVNAPVEISQYTPAPKEIFKFRDWARVAAAVAVITVLGIVVLNQFDSGESTLSNGNRQEETFHLVVKYEEVVVGKEKAPANRKVLVSSHPGVNKFLPVASATNGSVAPFEMADVDLGPPEARFDGSITNLPEVGSSFKLACNDSTSTGGKVIYSGEVVLDHDHFVLEADSLVIDRSAGPVPVLKALNGILTHREGTYQTEADAISFDPSTGELIARGVHRLFAGGIQQDIVNQEAVIVFEENDFFIQEGVIQHFKANRVR